MPSSFNSVSKIKIRDNWGKPLIEFISTKLEKKLFYLGLPSSSADDIHSWIDFLYKIYAFQCRIYPLASDDNQPRDEVLKLEENLLELERKKKIETFEVFDGYLEEVLINGKDNSTNTKEFKQNEAVSLYNLDFCNQITEPQKFFNENGEELFAFKMDALKKLIEYQKIVASNSTKFILFLTIHSGYKGEALSDFINNPPNNSLETYFNRLNKLNKPERKKRILRAFVHENIRGIFSNFCFNTEFLPTIHYTGINSYKLLHFTVVGTKLPQSSGGAVTYQKIESLYGQKFIGIDNEDFLNLPSEIDETDVSLNPVSVFLNSKTFKRHWQ